MKLKRGGVRLFNRIRSDVELAADMLRVKGSQTAIMYGANLSHAQTQKYLHQLSEMALIESVEMRNGRPLYGPTGKGLEFLGLVDQLEVLISNGESRVENRPPWPARSFDTYRPE